MEAKIEQAPNLTSVWENYEKNQPNQAFLMLNGGAVKKLKRILL